MGLKLIIDDAAIKVAIENYVNKQGVSTNNKHVEIDIIAKRNSGGVEATISISDFDSKTVDPSLDIDNSSEEDTTEESTGTQDGSLFAPGE